MNKLQHGNKIHNFLLLFISVICFFSYIHLHSGFVAETVVKTRHGYRVIADLSSSDTVTTYLLKSSAQGSRAIESLCRRSVSEYIVLLLDDELLICAKDQKFYSIDCNAWVKAYKLQLHERLCCLSNRAVCVGYIERVFEPIDLYDIRVDDQHCFCVTSQDIVVHNFGFVIGLAWAFGSGISFEGCTFGVSFLGFWLGAKLFKKKDGAAVVPQVCSGGCPNPCPDPEDDEEKKKRIYAGEDASYHHSNSSGRKSPSPKNGQAALDNSILYCDNSKGRIGISENEFVALRYTSPGRYHGHTCSWRELSTEVQNKLYEHQMVRNLRGKMWK